MPPHDENDGEVWFYEEERVTVVLIPLTSQGEYPRLVTTDL